MLWLLQCRCYVLCCQIRCDSFNKIQNESSGTKHFTSESLNSSHRHHFQFINVVESCTCAPKTVRNTRFQWQNKSPLPVRYTDIMSHTLIDRLVRPEGRSKSDGREVAGVSRLGVVNCHSVITETVRTQLFIKVCHKLAWHYRMKPWWHCVLIYTNCNYQVSYTTALLLYKDFMQSVRKQAWKHSIITIFKQTWFNVLLTKSLTCWL